MTRIRRGRDQRAAQQPSAPVAPAGLPGGSYRPLKDADLLRIVDAAKEVLERTGIQVAASPCREVFRAAGCRVDDEADRVYIPARLVRSEEHTSELQSLMRISYAVFCLKKKKKT